ncbi:unnamed protein product [Vicia faba]|uniref:TF-B3 domain-containing protein n=1 Tax=Vicia faba TaxID=3906 RepID=A0AAV1B455_VICFA|nr:unnamed protein product [Vicia faba]
MSTDHDQSLICLEAYVMFFEINSNQVNLEDVGVHQQHDNNVIVQNSHFNRLYYNAKLFWEKEITRNIPAEIVRKNFRADQTALSLIDLDKMEYYDCQILKGKKPHIEMYLKNGWYEYAKSKNFNVDDNLIFHYRSDSKNYMLSWRESAERWLVELMYKHPKPDPELVQFTGVQPALYNLIPLVFNAEENLTEDEEDYDVEEIDMMHVDHDPMDNEVSARKDCCKRVQKQKILRGVEKIYEGDHDGKSYHDHNLDLAKQIDAAGDNLPKVLAFSFG